MLPVDQESALIPRTEYGHFYKWVTSIGLALIIASVAVPWFIHQSLGNLAIPAQDLVRLTETAREVVEKRQNELAFVQTLEPWLFAFLLASGLLVTYRGLVGWKLRQDKLDEGEDVELATRRLNLEHLSADEQAIKVADEAHSEATGDETAIDEEPTGAARPTPDGAQIAARIAEIKQLEVITSTKLAEAFGPGFDISQNVRVRTSAGIGITVDAVAVARDRNLGTFLQDTIRVTATSNARPRIREALVKLAYASFEINPGRLPSHDGFRETKAAAVLLAVVPSHLFDRVRQVTQEEIRQVNIVLRRSVSLVIVRQETLADAPSNGYRAAILDALVIPAEVRELAS